MRKHRLCCVASALCVVGISAAAMADQVDNPVYVSWARLKPGTSVTVEQTFELPAAPGGAHVLVVTTKLLKVTPEKVVVENTSTSKAGDSKEEVEIPAKVQAGQELMAGFGPTKDLQPVVKNIKTGKQSLDVGGNKVETTTHEFTIETTDTPAMAGTVKTWTSPEVPGNLVKVELTITEPRKLAMKLITTEFKVMP